MLKMRGLISAGVAALSVTGALAQVHVATYNVRLDSFGLTQGVVFETGSSYSYASYGGFSVTQGSAQSPIWTTVEHGNVAPSSIDSLLMGLASDGSLVLFMDSNVASALNGTEFDTIFGTGSEVQVLAWLNDAVVNNSSTAQTSLWNFVSGTLTNFAYNSNTYNAWFNTTANNTTNISAVKFSGGAVFNGGNSTLTPVPEPITLALIGLAPLAYLKRRKSKAA